MSQIECHIGKMIRIDTQQFNNIEDYCKNFFAERGEYVLNSCYDSWEEYFSNSLRKEYIIVKENVYKILTDTVLDEGDGIFYSTKNKYGEIEYVVQYYNGGCCFTEAIEYAL